MQQIQRPIAFSVGSTILTTTRVKITEGQNTDVKVTTAKQYFCLKEVSKTTKTSVLMFELGTS